MKSRQSSTMPKYRQTIIAEITSTQRVIFSQAQEILKPYTKKFEVRVNTTEHYELWTTHGFRSRSFHPRNHKGFLFAGSVILKKSIGLYLYALHLDGKFNEKIGHEILPLWSANFLMRHGCITRSRDGCHRCELVTFLSILKL
jgi:hypothetical protein